MNLYHIESRPSKTGADSYDFFVACDNSKGGLKEAIEALEEETDLLTVLSRVIGGDESDANASK